MILPYKHQTYYGFDDGNSVVFVSNAGQKMVPLPLRLDIVNHSPTGFAWGYSGSGPAQLAAAILGDGTGCDHAARACTKDSKRLRLRVFLKSIGL